MIFTHATTFNRPRLPESLAHKINMVATGKNTTHEAELFLLSVRCLERQLNADHIDIENTNLVNVVFNADENVQLQMDNSTIGAMGRFIFYNLSKIRSMKLSDPEILTVFTEELVHHFYRQENEDITKQKTFEIIKPELPDWVTYDHIYKR